MQKFAQQDLKVEEFILAKDPGSELVQRDRWNAPTMLGCDKRLIIRFYGRTTGTPVSVMAASIKKIDVTINNSKLSTPVDLTGYDQAQSVVIDLASFRDTTEPIKSICESSNRALVDFSVYVHPENEVETLVGEFHLTNRHIVENYGVDPFGKGIAGLWLPVGVFATNFKRNDNGIGFSAMPIGIALGTRFWTSDRFYLGTSLVGMYAISSVTSEGSSTQTVSLTSVGTGGLLDLGSWIYLTGTYQWQLGKKAGEHHPGFMAGFGVGPSLTSFLAGNPK